MLTLEELEQRVIDHCGAEGINDFIDFLARKPINFWATEEPDGFLTDMVILALWKLIDGGGYQKILREVHLPFPFNHKSYQFNCNIIWHWGEKWGEHWIVWGDCEEWDQAAARIPKKGRLAKVNLWLDSFDLPMENPKGWSKKDTNFSYKLNRYGRRYMVAMDGLTGIRWVEGGYSPKVYDGTYMQLMRRELSEVMKGARVVADAHFVTAGEGYENTKFITPYPKPAGGKRRRSGEGVETLSKDKERFNIAQRELRARVEEPFGIIKQMFPILERPWREGKVELDGVVLMALAFHNLK